MYESLNIVNEARCLTAHVSENMCFCYFLFKRSVYSTPYFPEYQGKIRKNIFKLGLVYIFNFFVKHVGR